MAEDKKPIGIMTWLDEEKNANKIWYGLIFLCALSVLSDLPYHKHVKYAVEDLIPVMYGWYGLASCFVLVIGAKTLQLIVKRNPDYCDGVGDD